MADKTKELLAVLDLPEEEQWVYLVKNNVKLTKFVPSELIHFYLADLAFRLRDEVLATTTSLGMELFKGLYAVYAHSYNVCLACREIGCKNCNNDMSTWAMYRIKPIEMIIAALIAKELTKGEKDG